MPGRTLNVYVHVGFGFDVIDYHARYARGESIEYSPYDFHLAEREGVSVTFATDRGRGPSGRVMRALNRRLRFSLDHAWHNRRAIAAADVVWTMSENEAFAVGALMLLRIIPRRPIIGTAIWLFNLWDQLSWWERALFRLVSLRVDILTVHSKACLPVAAKAKLHSRVALNLFGINAEAFQPLPAPISDGGPIRVLSAGNDLSRDWPTLLSALGNDQRFVISAWTSVLGKADLSTYSNLRLPKPKSPSEIRRMYADAEIVVVAMRENIYSGITVALEGAAQNRPVVSSATGGVPTYFSDDEVRFVPAGDAAALRDAVAEARSPAFEAMAERAQARYARDDYTTRKLVERYLTLTAAFIPVDPQTIEPARVPSSPLDIA